MKTTTFLNSYLPATVKIFIQKDVTNVNYNLAAADKKNHCFLIHKDQQVGGALKQQLPINVSKRSIITYYTINYPQHKDFYNFFDAEAVVDSFLIPFDRVFPQGLKKISFSVTQKL